MKAVLDVCKVAVRSVCTKLLFSKLSTLESIHRQEKQPESCVSTVHSVHEQVLSVAGRAIDKCAAEATAGSRVVTRGWNVGRTGRWKSRGWS